MKSLSPMPKLYSLLFLFSIVLGIVPTLAKKVATEEVVAPVVGICKSNISRVFGSDEPIHLQLSGSFGSIVIPTDDELT